MSLQRLTDIEDKGFQPVPDTAATACHSAVVGWVLSFVLALGFLAVFWDRPVNHDTAWFLVATKDWLNGAELYRDIVEVNPPLNFYYTAPAVLISDAFGIAPSNGQFLVISVILMGVLGWCWRLLPDTSTERRMLLLCLIGATLVTPFMVSIAQREHIMILLIAPWIIGRLVHGANDSGDARRAGLAALGICVKPFFVLYPVALTIHEIVSTRSMRPVIAPANLVFLAVGLAYLAAAYALHPLYFTDIISTARAVYGEYGFTPHGILMRFADPAFLLAFAILASVALRTRAPALTQLLTLVLVSLAIYLIQWTGFRYQYFPIVSFLALGLGWLLLSDEIRLGRVMKVLAVVALLMIALKPLTRGTYFSSLWIEILVAELTLLDAGDSLMTFSTSPTSGPAVALRADLDWASRYPALWLVPGVVDGKAATDCAVEIARCATLDQIGTRTRDDIIVDLIDRRPDVLIFDATHNYIDDEGFSWAGFLSEDPRFGRVMQGYELVRDATLYDIYLRRDLTNR